MTTMASMRIQLLSLCSLLSLSVLVVAFDGGNHRCPCLSLQDLPGDVTAATILNGFLLDDRSQDPNVFGEGCGYHHQAEDRCRQNANEEPNSCDQVWPQDPLACSLQQGVPPECGRRWCIVDSDNCSVNHLPVPLDGREAEAMEAANDTNNTNDNNNNNNRRALWQSHQRRSLQDIDSFQFSVSYATCGDTDHVAGLSRQVDMLEAINHTEYKIGLVSEDAGWTGVYSRDRQHFGGDFQNWYGPTLSFVQTAALDGNFQLKITAPDASLVNQSAEYYGTTSAFDLCVYATSLGYLDFCVGDFTITNRRLFEAHWLQLHRRNLRLAVKFRQGQQSFIDQFLTFFRPFHWTTWLFMIAFVVPVLSIMMAVFEYGHPTYPKTSVYIKTQKITDAEQEESGIPETTTLRTAEEHNERLINYIPDVMYYTYLSLLTRFYLSAVTSISGKIHVMGIAFFLFGFGLMYTGNLAAQLTRTALVTPVNSFQDARDLDFRFCISRKNYDIFQAAHPNEPGSIFVADEDGLPGFANTACQGDGCRNVRLEVLERMDHAKAQTDPQYCHVAIVAEEDLEEYQRQSRFCDVTTVGPFVAEEPVGMPFFRHSSPSQTSVDAVYEYLNSNVNQGKFSRTLVDSRPLPRCDANNQEGTGFTIGQMGGIWAVSFAFAAAALVWFIAEPFVIRMRTQKRGYKLQPLLEHSQFGAPHATITANWIDDHTQVSADGRLRVLN